MKWPHHSLTIFTERRAPNPAFEATCAKSRAGASTHYKDIPAKSTKPLWAGFSETRLSSVQTIQPTHTKPATDRENKVRTAKLKPVFAAAVCAADLDERNLREMAA